MKKQATRERAEGSRKSILAERLECRLKEIRKQRGFSQRDVALFTGVNRQTVHAVESGMNVTILNAMLIARFLGVTLEELWPQSNADRFLAALGWCEETPEGEIFNEAT